MIKKRHLVFSLPFGLIFTGCSHNTSHTDDPNAGRYSMSTDKAPLSVPDLSQIKDASPRYEPYSRGGNQQHYTIKGETYYPLASGKGYQATGIASWYGLKFHGHLTANGESYDMYGMSAAHKTLPLPSFVKVTHLGNDKSVIVRVNDRGPFHQDRLIDLSYAAAHKLGMLSTGTAEVKLEVIHVDPPAQAEIIAINETKQHYIQVFASANKTKMAQLGKQLSSQYQLKSRLQAGDDLYRLQLGPITQQQLALELAELLKNNGYPNSYLISE